MTNAFITFRSQPNDKHNTSGVKGVSWVTRVKVYDPKIKLNGRTIHLGTTPDFDEAVCYRLAAEQSLNWAGCDDHSPAFKYVKEKIQGVR